MSWATAHRYLTYLHNLGRVKIRCAAAPAVALNMVTGGPEWLGVNLLARVNRLVQSSRRASFTGAAGEMR